MIQFWLTLVVGVLVLVALSLVINHVQTRRERQWWRQLPPPNTTDLKRRRK